MAKKPRNPEEKPDIPKWVSDTVRKVIQKDKAFADRVQRLLLATERLEMFRPKVVKIADGIILNWWIEDRGLDLFFGQDEYIFSYSELNLHGDTDPERIPVSTRDALGEIHRLVEWIQPPTEPYQIA